MLFSITSNFRETPRLAHSTLSEVNGFHLALESLHKLLLGIPGVPKHRTALIRLDQLTATLTDAVLIFPELEALITPLTVPADSDLTKRTRVKLIWEGDASSRIIQRLHQQKFSLSLMLNIIQWY